MKIVALWKYKKMYICASSTTPRHFIIGEDACWNLICNIDFIK